MSKEFNNNSKKTNRQRDTRNYSQTRRSLATSKAPDFSFILLVLKP
jgi:hypothetical protein